MLGHTLHHHHFGKNFDDLGARPYSSGTRQQQLSCVLVDHVQHAGWEKVDWLFVFSCAADNLLHLPSGTSSTSNSAAFERWKIVTSKGFPCHNLPSRP